MFSRFIHVATCQYFIPSYDWIIFHCMDIPYPLVDGQLNYFCFFTLMNNAAINVQVFLWTYIFNSLGVKLLGQMVTLCLTFWRTSKMFSTMGALLCIPTSNVWGFQFLHILANTCYFLFLFFFFSYSHPTRCEMVSQYGFDLHFPND